MIQRSVRGILLLRHVGGCQLKMIDDTDSTIALLIDSSCLIYRLLGCAPGELLVVRAVIYKPVMTPCGAIECSRYSGVVFSCKCEINALWSPRSVCLPNRVERFDQAIRLFFEI